MTLNELLECTEGLKKSYNLYYGLDKKPVDWLHMDNGDIILLCEEEDEEYWKKKNANKKFQTRTE